MIFFILLLASAMMYSAEAGVNVYFTRVPTTAVAFAVADGTSFTALCNSTDNGATFAWYNSSATSIASGPQITVNATYTASPNVLLCEATLPAGGFSRSYNYTWYVFKALSATPVTYLNNTASVSLTCGFTDLPSALNFTVTWARVSTGSATLTTSVLSTATNLTSTLVVANSTSAGDQYICSAVPSGAALGDTTFPQTFSVYVQPYSEMNAFSALQYTEGDSVTVACKALGYPVPTVTWTREGTIITPNVSTAVITGGVNVSFTISSIDSTNDRGAYACIATNGYGTPYVSATKTLHARAKLAPLWPAIGILVQIAVIALIIGVTESVRAKKALASAGGDGKHTARFDGGADDNTLSGNAAKPGKATL